MIIELLKKAQTGEHLTADEAFAAFREIMNGEVTNPVHIAAILTQVDFPFPRGQRTCWLPPLRMVSSRMVTKRSMRGDGRRSRNRFTRTVPSSLNSVMQYLRPNSRRDSPHFALTRL